jgi:hypothetical protein
MLQHHFYTAGFAVYIALGVSMLVKFSKLQVLKPASATKVLLLGLLLLVLLTSCGETRSYYLREGNLDLEITIEPFLIRMQPSLIDRRNLRIGIFPYSKAADGGIIEITCKDVAVIGDEKRLKRLRDTCPSEETPLQQQVIEVVFDLPDGPPSKIEVTMPKITVKKSGSQSEEIKAVYARKDYVRTFGLH